MRIILDEIWGQDRGLNQLSGDAVEPDQLAWLHDIGLGQPLRPAQGPGGAEVEWWKLGSMVCWGMLVFSSECSVDSIYDEIPLALSKTL